MKTVIGSVRRREQCRVCCGRNLRVFLDYGNVPLAGGFLLPQELTQTTLYPMDLAVCLDCSLVQILNVVSPEILFTDYRYLSSITRTLKQHFREYANVLKKELSEPKTSFVVDIGCNDGVLLEPLRDLGIKAVGVDAAENVALIARKRGFEVIHGFFGRQIATEIVAAHGQPSVVTASNVFAHIDDLGEVMRGVSCLLPLDGTFVVEVHYVLDLLRDFQFDTVYHEHLCYYSLHALQALFERFGLVITNVQRLPMHGGAIRVFSKRAECSASHIHPAVREMLDEERALGVAKLDMYRDFGERVIQYRDHLRQFLVARKDSGRSLSAFGAAGRATILLNYCGLDHSIVDYIVDESPSRCGRYVPGVLIPIVSPASLEESPTDDCLITAWNYRDEIIEKGQSYLTRGGCFIIPLPRIETIAR